MKQRKINIDKVIREIEEKQRIRVYDVSHQYEGHPVEWYNEALKDCIQIIKDNIKETEGIDYRSKYYEVSRAYSELKNQKIVDKIK